LRRQPLFGKPLPHPEVAAGLPRTLWLHPGQPKLLPAVFRLVQPRASSFRHRASHPRDGPLWPSSSHRQATPSCTRCRIPGPPGTFCPSAAAIIPCPKGGVD
jgi:hypothetical protein